LDEASKRRRVGLTAKTTGPGNLRARSVLSTINSGASGNTRAHPDNMSDAASTNESVIEFTCKEDVEKLLAEKLRAKKNDFKVLFFLEIIFSKTEFSYKHKF
jgi:hypothetical protein